ncbi:hypothetical protein DRP04_11055 [Archaeoglobales archaeon]|nr:MAG: hypothetical protein DRP04_11055 [Archaeoglobales archaeon]
MVVIATLDGHVIAKASNTIIVPVDGGNISMTITFPELRQIDAVLQIQVDKTDPPVNIEGAVGTHKNIVGNVVGFTIFGVSAGTTLTASGVVLGF